MSQQNYLMKNSSKTQNNEESQHYKIKNKNKYDKISQQFSKNSKYTLKDNYFKQEELRNFVKDSTEEVGELICRLQFQAKSLFSKIRLTYDHWQSVPAMLTLKTNCKKNMSKIGIDLICLVDVSENMQGQKIQMIKETLINLLDFLDEKDRFSVMVFNKNTTKLFNLKRITQENILKIKYKIEKISCGGDKDIIQALFQAFDVLQKRKHFNKVTQLFLFTDGQDNQAWNFFNQMSLDISQLKYNIHTFGCGNEDNDDDLMLRISEIGNGNYYQIQNIKLIDEVLIDAFGGIKCAVGKDIEIVIKCTPFAPLQELGIAKTYGDMWRQQQKDKLYQIKCPLIASGARKDFFFEIEVPPLKKNCQTNSLPRIIFQTSVTITCPFTNASYTKVAHLPLEFTLNNNDVIAQDAEVACLFYQMKSTFIIEQANKLCNDFKFDEAQQILQNFLLEIKRDDAISALVITIIDDIQQSLKNIQVTALKIHQEQLLIELAQNQKKLQNYPELERQKQN